MNRHYFLPAVLISGILFSCAKETIQKPTETEQSNTLQSKQAAASTITAAATVYTTYLIPKGQHYSTTRPLKSVSATDMKFFAKFNQSAIYQTVDPNNQYDINKLWGFSEGFNNQYNSARIGWTYTAGALRLHGYVYSKGVRYYKEITTVLTDEEISCSIKISGSNYIISAKGVSVTLPRGTTATTAKGFQQYPYFGGDEVAPQAISIFIKPV